MLFINILLDFFLVLFSFFIPKNKKTILYGAGDGKDFKGNPKYLYLYNLKNNPKLFSFWITAYKPLYHQMLKQKQPCFYLYSLKGFWAILRAQFLVIEIMPKDTLYAGFFALGRFKYIQTFHGMPLKKIGNDANTEKKGIANICKSKVPFINQFLIKIRNFFKKYFLYRQYYFITSLGKECSLRYQSAFGSQKIVETGFPRNDAFFWPQSNNQAFLTLKKQYSFNKIIAFVPTFRDMGSLTPFSEEGFVFLDHFLKDKNWLLCVKKHPYDKSLVIPQHTKRIIDVSELFPDVIELLVCSNMLITDYSSVFFDYCLTKQPIIFYSYDLESYLQSCRGMYYDYKKDLPGPFAFNEQELLALLKDYKSWFYEKNYQQKYHDFIKRFHSFTDGKSSKRLMDILFSNL